MAARPAIGSAGARIQSKGGIGAWVLADILQPAIHKTGNDQQHGGVKKPLRTERKIAETQKHDEEKRIAHQCDGFEKNVEKRCPETRHKPYHSKSTLFFLLMGRARGAKRNACPLSPIDNSTIAQGRLAIDQNMHDTAAHFQPILIAGMVSNGGRVKNRDIGNHAGLKATALLHRLQPHIAQINRRIARQAAISCDKSKSFSRAMRKAVPVCRRDADAYWAGFHAPY